MKMLQAKLYQMEQEKKAEEVNALKGDKKEITWGSQIRSYVFTPYTMVKDHRTGYEVAQVDKVMDGILKASSMLPQVAYGRIVITYLFQVLIYSISMKGRRSATLVVEY